MLRFLRCKNCGNMVLFMNNQKSPLICCGQEMKELVPNTTDAANEKHVPVVVVEGNVVKVTVGSVEHPMTEAHWIQFIAVETNKGYQIKHLTPTDRPYAEFVLGEGEEVVKVYEYCNLHGLWAK